jgi:hypothetical protein
MNLLSEVERREAKVNGRDGDCCNRNRDTATRKTNENERGEQTATSLSHSAMVAAL